MQPNKNLRSKLWRPDLGSLHEKLSQRIKGQPEVLSRLAPALIRRETDSVPQQGPRDAFFLAGPTGTGKTFAVETVADLVFGAGHFAVFDCSEFKTIESVAGLMGDRDGDPGRFAETYARVPAGVWLFDEIEKAHKPIVDLFLQIVWEGRVTPASGKTIDLCGIYIFVTSNLGSAEILGRQHLPFASLERYVVRRVE